MSIRVLKYEVQIKRGGTWSTISNEVNTKSPVELARKVLARSPGVRTEALEHAVTYLASPGGTSETVQIFCARVSTEGAGGVHGLDHENEDILVTPMKADDAFALLTDKLCDNSQTVIALQWLMLNENAIRAKWGFKVV